MWTYSYLCSKMQLLVAAAAFVLLHSAVATDPWVLVEDFSDEFMLGPVNTTRWNTSVGSWSPSWSWDPENVKIIPNTVINCTQLTPSDCFARTTCRLCEKASSKRSLCVDQATAVSLEHKAYTCIQRQNQANNFVDGMLAITMTYAPHRRDGMTVPYKSGILKSRVPEGITYGRFEARIRGAQVWPGVWCVITLNQLPPKPISIYTLAVSVCTHTSYKTFANLSNYNTLQPRILGMASRNGVLDRARFR